MPISTPVLAVGPRARRRARRARHLIPGRLILAVAVTVALALLGSGCSAGKINASEPVSAGATTGSATSAQDSATGTQGSATGTQGSATGTQDSATGDSAGVSPVATASRTRVNVLTAPGGKSKLQMKNPTAIGAPLTFLVLQTRPGWVRVSLPIRPNGSSGWVSQSDVVLSSTPYRLVISMSKHRLDVEYKGRRVARHPVGVGKVATPTPTGTYFITELIQPPDATGPYGPYAFGLSAFSNTLKSFAGGPGQLGLHGTDAPHGLGHDVSHGCLRVANSVITKLAGQIPLGTPIEIHS